MTGKLVVTHVSLQRKFVAVISYIILVCLMEHEAKQAVRLTSSWCNNRLVRSSNTHRSEMKVPMSTAPTVLATFGRT